MLLSYIPGLFFEISGLVFWRLCSYILYVHAINRHFPKKKLKLSFGILLNSIWDSCPHIVVSLSFHLNFVIFSRVQIYVSCFRKYGAFFIFHDTVFTYYPENHNTIVSFCFLNWGTKINLFLVVKLKAISISVCQFYENSFVIALWTHSSFL